MRDCPKGLIHKGCVRITTSYNKTRIAEILAQKGHSPPANFACVDGDGGTKCGPDRGVIGGWGYDRDRCRQAVLIVPHQLHTSHQISTSDINLTVLLVN